MTLSKIETILLEDCFIVTETYLDNAGLKLYKCNKFMIPKVSKTRRFFDNLLDFFFGKSPSIKYMPYSNNVEKTGIIYNAKYN